MSVRVFFVSIRNNLYTTIVSELSSIRRWRDSTPADEKLPSRASKALQTPRKNKRKTSKNIKFLFCPKKQEAIQPNINSIHVTMNLLIYLPQKFVDWELIKQTH